MAIKLNHTIVYSRNKRSAANFVVGLFGLPKPVSFGAFLNVEVSNEVTLAFMDAGKLEPQTQHYAFLVSEKEFDQIFGRVKKRRLSYWADPDCTKKGCINQHKTWPLLHGGRGVYFKDPSGHLLEIITRPYCSLT